MLSGDGAGGLQPAGSEPRPVHECVWRGSDQRRGALWPRGEGHVGMQRVVCGEWHVGM